MKKLSRLQKFIIDQAYRRHRISNPDILIKWYGFKPTKHGALNFDVGFIGESKYKSATVSVARALTRLRNRGLMRRSYQYGYNELTLHGRQLMSELLKTDPNG